MTFCAKTALPDCHVETSRTKGFCRPVRPISDPQICKEEHPASSGAIRKAPMSSSFSPASMKDVHRSSMPPSPTPEGRPSRLVCPRGCFVFFQMPEYFLLHPFQPFTWFGSGVVFLVFLKSVLPGEYKIMAGTFPVFYALLSALEALEEFPSHLESWTLFCPVRCLCCPRSTGILMVFG